MLRYATSFALAFFAAVAAVAAVNYGVDADGIYRARAAIDEFTRTYVERLIRSENGLVAAGDVRAIKLELARRTTADCTVTGSSREMELDAKSAPQIFGACRAVVNLAVPAGTFEDFIAVAGVIMRRDAAGTIFVGVSHWMLRRHVNQRFAQERTDYEQARAVLGLEKDPARPAEAVARYLNLLNAEYLRHNFDFVTRAITGRNNGNRRRFEIQEAQKKSDERRVFKPNGTLQLFRELRTNLQPALLEREGAYQIARPALDPAVVIEFERALNLLVRQGAKITILLMPYHPVVMSCNRPPVCETLSEVEGYIRDLGVRLGFKVIGSYDPRPFAQTGRDFADSMHLRNEALPRLRSLDFNPWTAREQ